MLIDDCVKTTRNVKYSRIVEMFNLQRSLDGINDGEENLDDIVTHNESDVELTSPQT